MVEYRYLGRSALKVSPLTLGSMMFGNQTPDDVAFRIIDKAREQGINFIDTADVYHDGKSEEVVGRGIKAHRDHWVVATKFVNSRQKGPNVGGYSRKWVYQTVENSLRNLGTDYIDILYFHRAVFDAPLEEPVRAIADLIKAGKLRYFGFRISGGGALQKSPISPTSSASTGRSPASRSITLSTARQRPSNCRRLPLMDWVPCPIARWRVAS